MRFAFPYWLFLMAFIPALIAFYMWAIRGRDSAVRSLVSARLHKNLVSAPSGNRRWASYILVISGLFFVIAALARPQIGRQPAEKERRGLDIEFMIDASYSMAAVDTAPNRFEAAKKAVSEIVKNLKGDRVGLTMFTNASLRVLPFTTDYGSVEHFLRLCDMKVFLNRGTNIEAAIAGTVPVFEKRSNKSKVMVILTDGEDDPDLSYNLPPEPAIVDLHLYFFGMGTEAGGPIPLRAETEEIVGYMKDSAGKDIVTRLEEASLNKMAGSYSGRYYRYSPEGVRRFINDLDNLKKEQIEDKENLVYVDYFQYFLIAGSLMIFIGKAVLED